MTLGRGLTRSGKMAVLPPERSTLPDKPAGDAAIMRMAGKTRHTLAEKALVCQDVRMSSPIPNTKPFPKVTLNGVPLPPQAIEFELLRLVRFYREHFPESQVATQMASLRQKAVDQAIGAKLLINEASRLDIAVTEADIDARIGRTETEAGGPEKLRELLKRQGVDADQFREQIRRSCRVEKLVDQAVSVASDPTEAQIRSYFEANRDSFQRQARAQAQHILVKPAKDDDTGRAAARDKAAGIRERLREGADFAAEAASHSDCPSGKQAGGSLGWVSRGMMVPAFDDAVFALPVGEISDLVETQFGYHVIHKTDEAPATPADFDDSRETIRGLLRHAARGDALAAYVAELREKADVQVD